LDGHTLGAETEIERVLQVGLVGCAAIQDDGERPFRVDTGGGRIEGELTNLG